MSEQLRDGYRIGVDNRLDGKVRAQARGQRRGTRTFPAGTEHEAAATAMASELEGESLVRVSRVSAGANRQGCLASDWAVYVLAG